MKKIFLHHVVRKRYGYAQSATPVPFLMGYFSCLSTTLHDICMDIYSGQGAHDTTFVGVPEIKFLRFPNTMSISLLRVSYGAHAT